MPAEFPPISDYSIIGDCQTAALVSRKGSIEWLCWPRFDSPSLFTAVLDRERGGFWRLSPQDPVSISRQYVRDSNVLETSFTTSSGIVVVTDLMPVRELTASSLVPDYEIVRRVTCTRGEVEIEMDLVPRKFGEKDLKIKDTAKLGLRFSFGRGVCWLQSSIPVRCEEFSVHTKAVVHAGESVFFSLSYSANAPAVLPDLDRIPQRIEECVEWWHKWAGQAEYDGEFRDEVIRSALTL